MIIVIISDEDMLAIIELQKKWLFIICEDRYTKIVKFLLKVGAGVNIKNHAGDTP